ncbi:Lrp/AsnC family transcriptional regulator [Amycolatopsis sp. BJA-103]|uniref:Lrp/AsnC family transcriptional regulator n=1 Tax=unclassified Amycolatopsis TaxID=2618356 RepID=UPI000C77922E|nr:Lrp/AsnC family transcriptional regulator [Amycolatopsis sp. BJA-103]AUI62318.1 AsnC family transcriptional regulator [Amycolatopsis sp. BJA-103]PNE20376.1 AsnC family transcriptional regulator [Amycolatopsis sp. BJA-103]
MGDEPRAQMEQRTPRGLDNTDRTLIALLQVDGRASFTALAKAVGLSEGAVRQRVQRLLRDETMQIVAVTDPANVGLGRQAMVGIRVQGDPRAVSDQLSGLPDVHYVVLTAGSFDLLAEIACRDDEHLLSVLNDDIRPIPGVVSTETLIYLKLAKQTYAWGNLTR